MLVYSDIGTIVRNFVVIVSLSLFIVLTSEIAKSRAFHACMKTQRITVVKARIEAVVQAGGPRPTYTVDEVLSMMDKHFANETLMAYGEDTSLLQASYVRGHATSPSNTASSSVKHEDDESLALWRDQMNVSQKQIQSQLNAFLQNAKASQVQMENMMKAFAQAKIGSASRTFDGDTKKDSPINNFLRELECYFCNDFGHMSRECPKQGDLLSKGVIKEDNNKLVLAKTGERIKREWPGKSTYERIVNRTAAILRVSVNTFSVQSREAYEAELYDSDDEDPTLRTQNYHGAVTSTWDEDVARAGVNAVKTRANGPVPDFREGPVMEKKTASKKSKSSPEGRGTAKEVNKKSKRAELRRSQLESEDEDLEDDVEIIEEPPKKTKTIEKEPIPEKRDPDPPARKVSKPQEDEAVEYTVRFKRKSKLDQLADANPSYAEGWQKHLDVAELATNPSWQKNLQEIMKKGLVPVNVNFFGQGSTPLNEVLPRVEAQPTRNQNIRSTVEPELPTEYEEDGRRIVEDFIVRQVNLGNSKGTFRARSAESAALRTLTPRIEESGKGECLLDSGSMICSISYAECQKRGIAYDPEFRIDMESANGSIERTLGLARNVEFNFQGLCFYLQLHVLDKTAYSILLGRPFEMISRAQIANEQDGSSIITLTDEYKQRISIPTQMRGQDPVSIPGLVEKEMEERRQEMAASAFCQYSRM